MKLVVTGNIGCGKSTAVGFLRQCLPTYQLFDFDKMVANLYQIDVVRLQLDDAFGVHDKNEISSIVHSQPEQMKKLRVILDSWILASTQEAFKQPNIILDIPLYFEYIESAIDPGYAPDQVLLICASEATQIERVKQRNGWSEEKIKSVIAKQLTQREKADRSNYLIMNTGTIEQLQSAIERYTKSRPF